MTPAFARLADGMRIAYDVSGTGPILLLLHGLESSRSEWHDLGYVEQLSPSFTVVAMDLRGHGDGIKVGSRFRLEDCADDIAALAEIGRASCRERVCLYV